MKAQATAGRKQQIGTKRHLALRPDNLFIKKTGETHGIHD